METQRYFYVEQGKQNKMHTLWSSYLNASREVKPQFITNLSTDSETAMKKAREYAKKVGVDESLVYDYTHDLKPIVKVHKWTESMVRFGKNYGKELRDCPETFIKWVAKGCPLQDEKSGDWYNNCFGGQDFQKIAQQIAVEMNLGVMEDRIYHSPQFVSVEQYNKTTERLAQKALQQDGHFFNSGDKVELTLTCINVTGYSSTFGYVNVYKFIDSDNRIFTYKGSATLVTKEMYSEIHEGKTYTGYDTTHIEKGDTITLTATIKHDEYRNVKSTYLQRIKIK
jgi:hypothetical protein